MLELSILFATQTNVDGVTALFNEVTRERYSCPIIDGYDMLWIPVINQNIPQFGRVLVDEEQDRTDEIMALVQAAISPDGSSLTVGDRSQTINQWRGVEISSLEREINGARIRTMSENFRSGFEIVEHCQPYLEATGCKVQVMAMKTNPGSVVTGDFFHHPIIRKQATIVAGRLMRHVVPFFLVLLSKKFSVSISHHQEQHNKMLRMLDMFSGSLAARQSALQTRMEHSVPSDVNDDYDLLSALCHCLVAFMGEAVNDSYATMPAFVKWLVEFFRPTGSNSFNDHIRCGTMHSLKGAEADTIYIINPDMSPLKERIAKGGWHEHEENCLAYMIRGRGKERLVYLPNLEVVTRSEILRLFEDTSETVPFQTVLDPTTYSPPTTAPFDSQETVDDAGTVSDMEGDDKTMAGPQQEMTAEVKDALATLNLPAMPIDVNTLNTAVRNVLLCKNASFANAKATDRASHDRVLAARALLIRLIN